MNNKFDWGLFKNNQWLFDALTKEFSDEINYEKFFKVNSNDIVVDIGASVGPFAYSVLKNNPKHIFCLEPHPKLFSTLMSNLSNYESVTCINKGISNIDNETVFDGLFNDDLNENYVGNDLWKKHDIGYGITFKSFIKEYNIQKIDFLKTDCEGGEYDIFNEENFDWIKQNIKKIAGEWHLHTSDLKEKFLKFRDLYLTQLPKFKIYFIDSNSNFFDITQEVWDNDRIIQYGWFSIYINNQEFNWGLINENFWFKEVVTKEIFDDNVYQKLFKVEENDIVVDIGASVGPFSWLIQTQKPKQIFCIEPHTKLFNTLTDNLMCSNAICINKAIGKIDGQENQKGLFNELLTATCDDANLQVVNSIKFNTFVKEYNIQKINFLKIDCEGGEYDIFNEENFNWIVRNIKKIAGEWHLSNEDLKSKFRKFRDLYLSHFDNYELYSMDGVNITSFLWSDWFIEYYNTITVYINNQKPKLKKWEYSSYPTLEFTTSIPKKGCVIDCVFCPQRTLVSKYSDKQKLSLDNFKVIIDKIPKEIRISFAGFTEPWLNQECTDMVLYAHEQGHSIAVFTTGIGMSIEDMQKIKHIPFSLGPNSGFVLHLPDRENKAKHPITKKYIELLNYIKDISQEIVNFRTMAMGPIHDDIVDIFPTAPIYEMWSRAGNLIGEAILKPELNNFNFSKITRIEPNVTCFCVERLYHNVVLPNGDVSLCCMDYGLEYIIGNILMQEYEDLLPIPYTCFDLCKFCENGISLSHETIVRERNEFNV